MNGSILPRFVLVAIAIAILVTMYEMSQSLRPPVCPECDHCRAAAELEARTRESLARDYAKRVGLDDENDDRRVDGSQHDPH